MKWKRIAAWMLAGLLSFALVYQPGLEASAEEDAAVYVRKHVSMLYDDSGSMCSTKVTNNLKWTFASYASQAFAGLLNDTDSLTITFMNHMNGRVDQLAVDLGADRAQEVAKVKTATGTVNKQGNTPLNQIDTALQVLLREGLEQSSGAQSEQYWLVLMTDGIFTDEQGNEMPEADVVAKLVAILEEYPDLHLVYFGIGTEGQASTGTAKDFRSDASLTAYSNFFPFYAKDQSQVVSTMQDLSGEISGRYDVTDSARGAGTTVTLVAEGESSPIRNVAVLAQNTNATLVSAAAEDGTPLEIQRSARLDYPRSDNSANVPDSTLGGCTALIGAPGGEKIPSGNITLTFSEPVETEDLTLMYEPAIHLNLTVEKQTPSGEWEVLAGSAQLNDGDTIRIDYAICEDGTNEPLDESAFFGDIEESITVNGEAVEAGAAFQVSAGDANISAEVSMMDGGYRISAKRALNVVSIQAADFQVSSSGPISLSRSELEENSDQYIDFTVRYGGGAAGADLLEQFDCEALGTDGDELDGEVELLDGGVIRFVPEDDDAEAGSYTVTLSFNGAAVCRESVTVRTDLYYTATSDGGFSVMDNEIANCADSVAFTVTAHVDEEERPITQEEAELFQITTGSEDGSGLGWDTVWSGSGVLSLIPSGDSAAAGTYTVSLVEKKTGESLCSVSVSVLKHDAVYAVEAIAPEERQVNLFALNDNETAVGFRIYADGQLCTAAQLRAMLDNGEVLLSSDRGTGLMRLETAVSELDGAPVVLCTPTSGAKGQFAAFLQRIPIAYGGLKAGDLTVTLTVDQPKGDSASGTLELSGLLFWRIFYIILPWLIALAAAAVFMVIYSNLMMPRFKKGVLSYVELTLVPGGKYTVGVVESEPTRSNHFYLKLFPSPQRMSFAGLTFEAGSQSARRKKRKPCAPCAVISGMPKEINKTWCSNLPNPDLLDRLFNELSGGEIRVREVPMTNVVPFDPAVVTDMEAQHTWNPTVDNGGYIVRKNYDGNRVTGMEIWGFLADD